MGIGKGGGVANRTTPVAHCPSACTEKCFTSPVGGRGENRPTLNQTCYDFTGATSPCRTSRLPLGHITITPYRWGLLGVLALMPAPTTRLVGEHPRSKTSLGQ